MPFWWIWRDVVTLAVRIVCLRCCSVINNWFDHIYLKNVNYFRKLSLWMSRVAKADTIMYLRNKVVSQWRNWVKKKFGALRLKQGITNNASLSNYKTFWSGCFKKIILWIEFINLLSSLNLVIYSTSFSDAVFSRKHFHFGV